MMRAFLLMALLTAACATAEPEPAPAKAPPARNCPPLPAVPAGANRATLLQIIALQAELYGRCAEGH